MRLSFDKRLFFIKKPIDIYFSNMKSVTLSSSSNFSTVAIKNRVGQNYFLYFENTKSSNITSGEDNTEKLYQSVITYNEIQDINRIKIGTPFYASKFCLYFIYGFALIIGILNTALIYRHSFTNSNVINLLLELAIWFQIVAKYIYARKEYSKFNNLRK